MGPSLTLGGGSWARGPRAAPMASASRSTPAPGPRNHGRHGWRLAPAGAAPHGLHRCLQRPWLSRRWQPGLLGVRATGSADGPHPRRWQASRRRAPWALRMALWPATEGANRWEHRRRCGWPHRPGKASSLGQQAIASADGTESHPENALGRLYHPDWKPQRFPPQALQLHQPLPRLGRQRPARPAHRASLQHRNQRRRRDRVVEPRRPRVTYPGMSRVGHNMILGPCVRGIILSLLGASVWKGIVLSLPLDNKIDITHVFPKIRHGHAVSHHACCGTTAAAVSCSRRTRRRCRCSRPLAAM